MRLSRALREAASIQGAQVKHQLRAAVRMLVILLVVALLLVCALVFLMTGAYHSLNETLPDWQAGALVALGAVVVALLLLAVGSLSGRRPARPRRPPPADRGDPGPPPGDPLAEAATDFLRHNRPTGLDLTIAAFVVGLLASRSRGTRRPGED